MNRIVTTTQETAKPTTPFIRLRGKWLEAHGFKIGQPVYIYETDEGLMLSPKPKNPIMLTTLEQLKETYKSLGIDTERKK